MELPLWKVVSKCARVMYGGQYVIVTGVLLMLELFADSLAIQCQVYTFCKVIHCSYSHNSSPIGTIATSSRTVSFGRGITPLALNRIHCSGSETRLIDCGASSGSCYYYAGVRCHTRTGMGVIMH